MRIRSIKPEFWASEDIASLPWETRLLFIGLWSYVDDNGVGRDNAKLIVADLFPLEDDPRETLARVSRDIPKLTSTGLVTRYQGPDGRPYLYITGWRHQRIDKPAKDRYPLPTRENVNPRESVARVSRDRRETVAPGTGEQGNRGTGEQGSTDNLASSVVGAVVAARNPDDQQTAQTLIAEWVDHCETPPPSRVRGHIAREVKQLLVDGICYDSVRAGLAEWNSKDLHPSTLPSIVHGIGNRAPSKSRRQNDQDEMFDRAMERARALDGAE